MSAMVVRWSALDLSYFVDVLIAGDMSRFARLHSGTCVLRARSRRCAILYMGYIYVTGKLRHCDDGPTLVPSWCSSNTRSDCAATLHSSVCPRLRFSYH